MQNINAKILRQFTYLSVNRHAKMFNLKTAIYVRSNMTLLYFRLQYDQEQKDTCFQGQETLLRRIKKGKGDIFLCTYMQCIKDGYN